MAIVISIMISLITGVSIMYNTQYFWGKESNSNINTMNCTINNMTSTFSVSGFFALVIVVVAVAAVVMFMCTARGF